MAKNMMKQNTNGAMKATTIRGEKHVQVDTPAKPKVSAVSDDKALNASYREDTLGRSWDTCPMDTCPIGAPLRPSAVKEFRYHAKLSFSVLILWMKFTLGHYIREIVSVCG